MAVIPIVALAILAVVFLLFLCYQVWLQSGGGTGSGDLSPVDLEALRNLTDPEEAHFLRVNLSPKEFRRIQRIRLRVTSTYISVISENASRLIVLGRSASAHPDREIGGGGLDLVHRALQLKLWCALALLDLNLTILFPTFLSPSARIAERYGDVTTLLASLPRKIAA